MSNSHATYTHLSKTKQISKQRNHVRLTFQIGLVRDSEVRQNLIIYCITYQQYSIARKSRRALCYQTSWVQIDSLTYSTQGNNSQSLSFCVICDTNTWTHHVDT